MMNYKINFFNMKTLVVKYLPSGEKSNTSKLLDLFIEKIKGKNCEVVDLIENPAETFDLESMAAYYKRNYGGQKLNEIEEKSIAKQDKLKKQLLASDVLVMAYPMHNFGMPARAKAYLDAVIMKGETFEPSKKLMAGKKALTLFTSGGEYNHDAVNLDYPNWDTISMLAKINFGYMGFDEAEVIGTSLRDQSKQAEKLAQIDEQITQIVKKWYK